MFKIFNKIIRKRILRGRTSPFTSSLQEERPRLKFLVIFLLISFVIIPLNFTQSAFNPEINYQGKLTDSAGVAVTDGDYNMEFKLYTVSSGGSAIWTETLTTPDKVTVTSGLFSVLLGNVTSIASVDFGQDLYLGVNIGGTGTASWDGEMTPRKQIASVPSAFEAEKLDGLDSTSFLRSDDADTMASSSVSTLLSLVQSGVGNILSLFDGATEVLTVKDGGNIGIGSTTPVSRLVVGGTDAIVIPSGTTAQRPADVTGALRYNTTSSQFEGYGGTNWSGLGGVIDVDQDTYILSESSSGEDEDFLQFYNAGSETVRITSDGNMGIGSTTPAQKLSVAGKIYTTEGFQLPDGTLIDEVGDMGKWSGTGDIYYNTGNVGIGSTAPTSELDVVGKISATSASTTQLTSTTSWLGTILSGVWQGTAIDFSDYTNATVSSPITLTDDDIGFDETAITSLTNLATVGTIGSGTWEATDIGVAYGGTGASTLTDHGVLVGSGTGAITPLAIGTDGQILVGSTGADPIFATLTAGDHLTATIGAGTLELDVDDDWYDSLADISLTYKSIFVGNSSGNPTATSSLTILDSGYVGIGTTTPMARLSVSDTTTPQFVIAYDTPNFANFSLDSFGDLTMAPSKLTATTTIGSGDESLRVTATGNIGIGTSTPAQKLSVEGKIYSALGGFQLPDGTIIDEASDLGTAFLTHKYTYVGNSAGSAIATSSLAITDLGNVGVGTTTPTYKFAINSATSTENLFQIATTTNQNILLVNNDGNIGIGTSSLSTYKLNIHGSLYADDIYTSGSTFYMGGNPLLTRSTDTLDFGVETGENIDFTINNTSALYITSSSNIGVGTSSPLSLFSLQGIAGSSDIFTIASSTGTNLFTFDNFGNLGIGSTTPAQKLSVAGKIYSTEGFQLPDGYVIDAQTDLVGPLAHTQMFVGDSSGVATATSTLTILDSGNIGIGTTVPNYKLDIDGNIRTTGTLYATSTEITNLTITNASTTQLTSTTSWIGTVLSGIWNGTAIDVSDYTNLVGGTNITLSGDTLNVDDAFLVNDANDTTTGQLTATNFVASSGTATSTFAGGLTVQTDKFVVQDDTGFVGIGTTGPQNNLHIGDSTTTSNIQITNSATGATSSDGALIGMVGDELILDLQEASSIVLKTNGGTALTLQGDNDAIFTGKVGIGTIDPVDELVVAIDSTVADYTTGTSNANFGLTLTNKAVSYATDKPFGISFAVSSDSAHDYRFAGIYGISTGISNRANGDIQFATRAGTGSGDDLMPRMTIKGNGNVGIGTVAPTTKLYVSGDIYTTGNMSALTITDRTPIYEGDALTEIKKIKGKDGEIDHSTLPEFVRVEKEQPVFEKQQSEEEVFDEKLNKKITKVVEKDVQVGTTIVEERNIGNMISMNVRAIQQLAERIGNKVLKGDVITYNAGQLLVENDEGKAQVKIAFDDENYAELQVTAVGDLDIGAVGADVRLPDDNLSVCSGGACPSEVSQMEGTGNLAVENDMFVAGSIGIGTSTPDRIFNILEAGENPQMKIAYDIDNFAEMQVSAVGDLLLSARGGDVKLQNENMQICSGGACPSSAGLLEGVGNLVVENTAFVAGALGVGTAQPSRSLDVYETQTNPQMRISYDEDLYSELSVSATGDLTISAEGGDVSVLNENLRVCSDDGCPTSVSALEGAGNLVVENNLLALGNVGINTASPSYTLDVNGTLRARGITDASDIRLKTNIQNLEKNVGMLSPHMGIASPHFTTLSKLQNLRGVTFEWIDDELEQGSQIGMIAQELEKEYPALVSTDEQGFKSIQYGKFTAVLLEAVKELFNWSSTIEYRSEKLEGRMTELEKENEGLKAKTEKLENRLRALEEVLSQ